MLMPSAVLLVAVVACAPLRAQQGGVERAASASPSAPEPTAQPATVPPPQIVTSARGESRVTPDRALIEIGVQTRAQFAAAAAAENARKQRAVLDTLRALGIPQERLSTVNYSVFPEMRHDERGQEPRVIGYTVSNTVRAELHQLDRVGQIIDAALAKGANFIHSLNFFASNTEEARRQALVQAVGKACAEASVMARAAGGALTGLLELSTGEFVSPPIPLAMMRGGAMEAQAAPTPVSPGEQTVTVFVTGRWGYDQGRTSNQNVCPRP
jgi:uncharacterized protein YggE